MDWDRQTDEYTLDIKSQGVGGRKMKLNFGPLFSAIGKNFLSLDFFKKFQKFSLPIDWKLSKNIKTLVFQAVLMVKSTKEWKKLKTKIQGVGGSNCSKFDFDHPFSPK